MKIEGPPKFGQNATKNPDSFSASDREADPVDMGRVNQRSRGLVLNMMTGSISIFFAEVLMLPVGFITAVFLARQLGPMNFGLFALALRLVTWIEWTGTSVFYGATVKFVSEETDWQAVATTVLRLHLLVGGGIAALLWLLSTPLAHAFNEPAMATYLKIFAIDIPIFSLVSANRSILVGRGLFKERARTSSSYWITRLVLIVLFVEMGLSVTGAILGIIGASVVALVISRFYVRPAVFSGPAFPVRRLWGFAAPIFMASLSLRMLRLDLIALKLLGGTAAHVGFYSAGQSLSMPASIFSQALSSPLLSTLSRLLSEGDEVKAKEIGRTAMRSVIWLLPFAAMTAGAASEIVGLIFGHMFLSAGPILAFLVFAAVGFTSINVTKVIIVAVGKPRWTFGLTGPLVPLALIGHLILITWLGGVGASIVTTSLICSGAFAGIVAVYKIWGVLPPAKTVLKSAFCSGIAFILAVLWPASGLVLILKLVAITSIILLTFLILGDFTSGEIALIRSMLRLKKEAGTKRG